MPFLHHRVLVWLLLAAWSVSARSAHGQRYLATFVDGSTSAGDEVRDWHDTGAQPKLGDRPLLDEQQPLRSLRDRALPLAGPPTVFVELAGGDRLPGEVTAYREGDENPYDLLPPHLLVEPAIVTSWPDTRARPAARVLTRWLRRIVWQSRGGDRYLPGTLFQRDGRQLSFRSLRWLPEGVRILVADGPLDVPFAEIAELHLPRLDPWDALFEQLAALSPDLKSRILRVEADGGLRVTTSTERFQARNNGSHPDHWYHAVQPAWSLEPLWLRHRTIAQRSYFSPREVPASIIEPVSFERRALLASSWTWQADRNVQGGGLRSAGRDFAWGLGMHAHGELTYALPPIVRAFRAQAGLDQAAGNGGCVRLAVYVGDRKNPPAFQSKILVGSKEIVDVGPIEFAPADAPQTRAENRQLTLVADPVSRGRPSGADPLDIRDTVDWLEPIFELDADLLRGEVASRAAGLVPAWQGWTLAESESAPVRLVNTWDDIDNRALAVRLQAGPRQRLLSLTRQVEVTPEHKALLLVVSRFGADSAPAQVFVEADGELLGTFDVTPRHSLGGPDPLWAPLDKFLGQTITVRLTQPPLGPDSLIDWRSVQLVERWPGLLPLVEEDPKLIESGDAPTAVRLIQEDSFSGSSAIAVAATDQPDVNHLELAIPIRETPRLGEFRYLRFAWKKTGGGRICLSLGHDGQWGPSGGPGSRDKRTFRYDGGSGKPSFEAALRVERKVPEEWSVVTRDLYNDFGQFTLTGLSFAAPDGTEARFDHIYLGRTQQDFTRIEAMPSERKVD